MTASVSGLLAEWLLIGVVAAPLATFLALGFFWLLGAEPGERTLTRLTGFLFALMTAAMAVIIVIAASHGWAPVTVYPADWFRAGEYRFQLQLAADSLSLPLLALTVMLTGIIGSFSSSYLHRERGFLRFFALLHLFTFGSVLAFAAASLDLLVAGWELVGLTSVLLIGFFHERPEPVRSSLRAFGVYRLTDIGLLTGVFLLHHLAGTASAQAVFRGNWPDQLTVLGPGAATAVSLLFLFAAAGKSAQAPFSGWLPRAMEGPTPSSAIFYGAISVHLGIYLMLRAEPLLQASPAGPAAAVVLGLVTAVHATLSGRVATDAKTLLAYATLTQLGVIFIEAGLGMERLAVIHLTGHAMYRTLQFLRAPSMLRDYHRMHAAAGGRIPKAGEYLNRTLPATVRRRFYLVALDRCHLDNVLDRLFTAPFRTMAKKLAELERGEEISPRRLPSAGDVPAVPELTGAYDA